MPLVAEIDPDASALIKEIEEFRAFLNSNPRGERKHFLPFFEAHLQLCAYLGTLVDRVSTGTHVKVEVPLWGDFVCDLIAGNLQDAAFLFVEFEDASATSLFRPEEGRKNAHWGTRVEHGVSQVVDWLFRIDRETGTDVMERDFGARHVTSMGLVIVGRSSEVSVYNRHRLDWRSKNTIVGGAKLSILTYDDLLEWLDGRAAMLKALASRP